jgi:hypothetical protein
MKATTKSLHLGAALAALASIAAPGVAAEPRSSPARELAAMRLIPFERMDTDKSGELGDTELPIPLSPSYPRADINGSGGIDRTELEAELARLEARLARGPALDPAAPPKSWEALDAALDALVAHHELDGVALLIGRGERVLFEGYAGSYGPGTLINMASASKWPAGAAACATPRDFSRFLMMMAQRGKVGGKQVYPAAAVELIERDYARGLPHRWQGAGAEGGRSYGFALWCEETTEDGTCPVISSGGAWGTMPWIDRQKDVWGLFFVYDRGPRMRPDLNVLRGAAEDLAAAR